MTAKKNFKLKNLIEQSRLTQAEVAREAKLSSESRLSRIIAMKVNPTGDEIKSISELLRVRPEQIGFGVGRGGK